MAEFKISRFRYNWRGAWAVSTAYNRDDVIRYGGKVYVCLLQHTSDSANIYADINYTPPGETVSTPRWTQMLDGYAWRGAWANTTYYNLGDLVLDGGIVYRCTTAHTSSSTLSANLSNWAVYTSSQFFIGSWANNISYRPGQVIAHGGNLYNCLTQHTSSGRFETDDTAGRWDLIFSNVEYRGAWVNYTRYKVNDLVNYGSNIWICTQAHDGDSN